MRTSSAPESDARPSNFIPNKGSLIDKFYESQTIDSATTQNIYIPKWHATNDVLLDNADFYRQLLDHVTHRGDAKIVALKARLELVKKEAAEVVVLCGYVSKLETRTVARSEEVDVPNKQNVELLGKVSVLESEREELNTHIIELGANCLSHGIWLAVMKCAKSVEFRSALGRVISLAIDKGIQEGLEVGIKHEKAGRSLTQVEAYDLGVEAKYVPLVHDFKNVSFTFLYELESLKDSPKDDHGNKMPLSDVGLVVRMAVEARGLCSPSSSALGGGGIPTLP
nr:hypothetical protein [Tanacetum cinerariifolium]